jgi:hypothetical protein
MSRYIEWLHQPIHDDSDDEQIEISPNTIQQYTYSPHIHEEEEEETLETIINNTTNNVNKSMVLTGKPTYGKKKNKSKIKSTVPEIIVLSQEEYLDVVSCVDTQRYTANLLAPEHTQYLLRAGVMGTVFSYLTADELLNWMIVNKQFYKMCSSNYLWKSLYFERWKRLHSVYNNKSKSYKEKYLLDRKDHYNWYAIISSYDVSLNITLTESDILHKETNKPVQLNTYDITLDDCYHCRSNNVIYVISDAVNGTYKMQCKDCLTIVTLSDYFSLFF